MIREGVARRSGRWESITDDDGRVRLDVFGVGIEPKLYPPTEAPPNE